ncbi:MAG: TIGR02281 family clan AA aspartic protease [Burkholderiales bacterium]|nr:TIGR02281 family clan AA aspartic protease [Burkholderiales bacterium]
MSAVLIASLLPLSSAEAAGIDLIGLFPGKAVLVIDGGSPKTYAVGGTIGDGMKLISVDASTAVIEDNGRRETLMIGIHHNRITSSGRASVSLDPDSNGHYFVNGQINGGTVRMMVDTGASMIAMPASEAQRLGINYKKGSVGYANTANGVVPIYRVKIDTLKIGDIEVSQVDAAIQEGGLSLTLLGNSFLNRMELKREGVRLTLTKRF